MTHPSRSVRQLVLAGLCGLCACAPSQQLPDPLAGPATAAEQVAPLGGAALAQQRHEMQRAHRDMVHFHSTLRSLRYRGDRKSTAIFGRFLHAYMGLHVDPLLRPEWPSSHPELMGLDANLRFAKGALLLQMREESRVLDVAAEISSRFRGREDILVEYPIGSQHRLGEGLEILRGKRWWSP
jgi:hypothetical protein